MAVMTGDTGIRGWVKGSPELERFRAGVGVRGAEEPQVPCEPGGQLVRWCANGHLCEPFVLSFFWTWQCLFEIKCAG